MKSKYGSLVLCLCTIGMALASGTGWATDRFNPQPVAVYDEEPYIDDLQGNQLWDRVELLEDLETNFFQQETFLPVTEWQSPDPYAPWIEEMFGDSSPHSRFVLLHYGIGWDQATQPVPVLIVPGAGDNASRSAVVSIYDLRHRGYACFSLTFAHNQGDNYYQAEQIANAIARIKAVTGARKVDVIAHSKGNVAVSIYLSNQGQNWGLYDDVVGESYRSYGTIYRGDVRRYIQLGPANLGVDTAFRWPASNSYWIGGSAQNAPTSWQFYYPYTSVVRWIRKDLRPMDMSETRGDAFPGQNQLLYPWDDTYKLPGASPELGLYAYQQDWYTTYYGGYGFYSYSRGLEWTAEEGGNLITKLDSFGLAPGIEVAIAIGDNPLLPYDYSSYLHSVFGPVTAEVVDAYTNALADYLTDIIPGWTYDSCELEGILSGDLMIGEISGPSDGLVFISSATHTEGLTRNGARLLDIYEVPLSHLDYMIAVQEMADYLYEQAAADPDECWQASLADRYVEADLFGWIDGLLKQ